MTALDKFVSWEVVKRAVRVSIGLRKVTDWILWMGWPPPKQKKRRPKHSYWKRTMVVQLDQLTFIRDPLGVSSLAEGAAGAVGE